MATVGSDTMHPLLAKKNAKTVQQIHFRVALDDIYHEYWVEGDGYLTEDNQLWVPSSSVVRERILPGQWQSCNDDNNKDEDRYKMKGEVATSLAKFIPYEAIPPRPNTFDEQESWEKEAKFFHFLQQFRLVKTVSYRTGQDDWDFCPTDEVHSV